MKSNLPIDEALYEQGYNQAIKDLDDFNWSSFRREAAKDILPAVIAKKSSMCNYDEVVKEAIEFADELLRQLKDE